jgi:AsmA protein
MRWIVRGLSGIFALILLAVGLVYLIPSDKVANLAAAEFSKATGRVLVLEGGVKPSLWPVLGVKTGPVQIANASWSDQGPMLAAEGLSIGVDMAALIGGTIRITKVEAIAPQILLERNKKGEANWVFGPTAVAGTASGSGVPASSVQKVTLDHGLIRNGSLRFIDHANGTNLSLTAIEAELRLPDYDGEALLTLAAQKQGQTMLVDAKLARFGDFAAGKVSGISFSAGIGASGFKFEGRMGVEPMVADGTVTADLGDLAAVMALVGLPAPDLPPGLGQKTRKIAGQVTLAPEGSVHLRGGVISLDGNRFEGDADLLFDGARPHLKASIKTGALSLAALSQGSSAGGGTTAKSEGWSQAPIDVSGLSALDAAISLSADSIDLGVLNFGRTRLMISLVKSRAVFEARELQAYGGSATGEFVINGRGGLSVGGNLKLSNLAMQPLLTDLAEFDRLVGTGDLDLRFLGVGSSMAALAKSLSGEGKLNFGKGELRGLDLLGMLRTLNPSYVGEGTKTIFDAVSASYTMQDGVLYNDDLLLAAPYLKATGKGRVGIGARDLDYRIVPTALEKSDGTGGIKVPLKITGPWAKPKYQLDLKALADQELADEKAKLKEEADKARAKLEAKAETELGVVRQEGESLTDAAKRRAQEAAKEEGGRFLNKLLGGN